MVKRSTEIVTPLFLAVGDLLQTDGWDRHLARRGWRMGFEPESTRFADDRYCPAFVTREGAELTFERYTVRIGFTGDRPSIRARLRRFIFARSGSYPPILGLHGKVRHWLKIAGPANQDARKADESMIWEYKADRSVGPFFTCSCSVHEHRPDAEEFRPALDIARAPARQAPRIGSAQKLVGPRCGGAGVSRHPPRQSSLLTHVDEIGLDSVTERGSRP